MATIRDTILCQSTANIFVSWLFLLPSAIVTLLLFPIYVLGGAFTFTINDLAAGYSTSFPADATQVPTFYVPNHRYSKWFHALLLMALGSIFGAIHCAGWNFPFPTDTEQNLWRLASLAVTIIPIAALPFGVMITAPYSGKEIVLTTFLTCMVLYVCARLVLLGLALTLLSHLPPSVYIAVNWTKFYPHIS